MNEKEKRIIETFRELIPFLSNLEKEKLLSFGEGVAFKINEVEKRQDKSKEPQSEATAF